MAVQSEPSVDEMIASVSEAPAIEQAPVEQAPVEQAAPVFKYKALGKEIEEPIDMILQRASQGYDYSQKMEQLKREREDFEAKNKSVQEMESRWKQYDDYARENPEWADLVQSQWQQSQSERNQTPEIYKPLVEKISQLESFVNETKAERIARQKEQEDAALNQTIESIRKEYPDINFGEVDPTGKSLEYRVLEHATQNGIKSFKAAFRDLYFDDLVNRATLKAKDTVAKDIAKKTKSGLLGESQAPSNDFVPLAGRSYEELTKMAREELGF